MSQQTNLHSLIYIFPPGKLRIGPVLDLLIERFFMHVHGPVLYIKKKREKKFVLVV